MSDAPPTDLMDYPAMTQTALRGIIRQALLRAGSREGLPGEHHFYITFLTAAAGVSVPPDILARYPNDMTIVLQHQFRDLRVTDTFFRVTLAFGGIPKILTVPWGAVVRFHDPVAQFTLMFEADEGELLGDEGNEEHDTEAEAPTREASIEVLTQPDAAAKRDTPPAEKPDGDDKPKIVSLDQFRKK